MKLMVQVAFDLEDYQQPEYDAVEGWLAQIRLRWSVENPDGTVIRLPSNTFISVRDTRQNVAQAIELVKEQFRLSAFCDFCMGRAFITAVLFDGLQFDFHDF